MIFSRLAQAVVVLLLLLAMFCGSLVRASSPADEQDEAVEAVRQMFVALTNDDLNLFKSVTSDDFYAFDVGKRFNGDALLELVKKAHASGKVYTWKVTDHEVKIEGNSALVTYINRGSIRDATSVKEMNWLESAVLRKNNGVWRIHFFHSTRIPSE